MLDRHPYPHPPTNRNLGCGQSRAEFKSRGLEREPVVVAGDAQCLAQASRTGAEPALVRDPAVPAHGRDAIGRLECPDQNGAGAAGGLADEIEAPVNAIRAINIGVAGSAEHYSVAWRAPAIAVGGRIGVVIGLDLDDDPADPTALERGTDQVGSDCVHAARKEAPIERW